MTIRLLLGGLFASVLGTLLTKEMHVSCISPLGVMGDHQQVGAWTHLLFIYNFIFCLRRFAIGNLKQLRFWSQIGSDGQLSE